MRFRNLLGAALLSGAIFLGGSGRAEAGWYHYGPRVAIVAGAPYYYAPRVAYWRYRPYFYGYYAPRPVVVRPYSRPFVGVYFRR